MKDKKTRIAIISVVALLLVLIGVTYAYWLVTKTQTNSNIISSACLDIALDNESNDISLSSQYPMSDEDGMKLTPYTFTVTNNCNTSIDYQVALEAIGDKSASIASSALKVALDNNFKLYSNYGEVVTTISGSYESRSIGYSRLAATGNEGSSATHSVRIWIDENAPISEANKTFQSKISVTVGQGIDSPYEKGTLAYDILANYGGINAISEIDAQENNIVMEKAKTVDLSESGCFEFGTDFTFYYDYNIFELANPVSATGPECKSGEKSCGNYMIDWCSYSDRKLFEITDWDSKVCDNCVSVNLINYAGPVFAIPTGADDAGLHKEQDDLGESYYFRGNVTNNYVQFGSYKAGASSKYYKVDDKFYTVAVKEYPSLEACEEANGYDYYGINGTPVCQEYSRVFEEDTPMYWRIVRINGDGTIRLIYDGTEKVVNGAKHIASIAELAYNFSGYEAKHVGYTFDTSNSDTTQIDSSIKTVVDGWYNNYLKTNYGTYIADGIFCNDKEVTSETYYDADWNEIADKNAAVNISAYYGAHARLYEKKAPRLTCTRAEDRYTKTTDLGNGLLTHPVGLLTADEATFAGSATSNQIQRTSNTSYYLYSGEGFWTFSPKYYASGDGTAYMLLIDVDGGISDDFAYNQSTVRPVINLRADVEFTGDGSFETPYVIKTN